MRPRRICFAKVEEARKSTVANIDNCNYIIRTADGRTIYTFSKKAAEYSANQGNEVFRRIRWFEDDI